MVLSKKVESLITSFTIVTNITILPIGTKRNSSKYTEELCILFYFWFLCQGYRIFTEEQWKGGGHLYSSVALLPAHEHQDNNL